MVVEIRPLADADPRLAAVGTGLQTHPFVFHRAPELLDEDAFPRSSPASPSKSRCWLDASRHSALFTCSASASPAFGPRNPLHSAATVAITAAHGRVINANYPEPRPRTSTAQGSRTILHSYLEWLESDRCKSRHRRAQLHDAHEQWFGARPISCIIFQSRRSARRIYRRHSRPLSRGPVLSQLLFWQLVHRPFLVPLYRRALPMRRFLFYCLCSTLDKQCGFLLR